MYATCSRLSSVLLTAALLTLQFPLHLAPEVMTEGAQVEAELPAASAMALDGDAA